MFGAVKSAILGMAVAATTLTVIPAANAGNNWNRYGNNWNHHYGNYHGSNGDAIAAGVLGLAAGAIIGGILAQPTYRSPVYADPYRYQNLGPVGSYYTNGYYSSLSTPAVRCNRGAGVGTTTAATAIVASIRAPELFSVMMAASISARLAEAVGHTASRFLSDT